MRIMNLLAAACLLVAATAVGASPIAVIPDAKIQPALVKVLEAKSDNARVRAIVSLEADLPPGLDRAAAIAAAQDRVLGAFKSENNGAGLAVLTRYRTLFGFSAELNRGQVTALAKRGDVTYIEEMPVHEKLWPESHPLTDVDLAQNAGYDGSGAVIAIIDDGIDDGHAAFTGKLLGGYDFADFDSDPTIDCTDQSHGTAVAGVALGNGGGVLGVASGAKMVFLKIQSSGICGSNSLDGDIVGAIDWAVANQSTYGIDIISMSLGGGLYSSESSCDGSSFAYYNAMQNAVNEGITVIAASGNDGMCDSMSRPACFSNVVSVGAVYDENLGNIGWCVNRNTCANSSRNPGCPLGYEAAFEDAIADNVIVYSNSAGFLDVAAPATCATSAAPGGGITTCFGGTSSATPFTSGTAALVVQAAGKGVLGPTDVRDILVSTGNAVTDPKNGRVTPRVNGLAAADEAATYGVGEPPNVAPQAAFSFGCNNLDCSFTDASSDTDGTIVSWSWNFGDGATSGNQNPSHAYAAAGTYTVTLTVTDDGGATDSVSQEVTATDPDPGDAILIGSSTSVRNKWTASVEWSDGSPLTGEWSTGDTCSGEPVCSLSGINRKVGSVTFTADNGDSIVVNKP